MPHERAEQIMNEAYFGKTPAVKKIEHIIDQIKQKYNGKILDTSIHTDPLRFKLNKVIEDAFGFGVVDVQFVTSMGVNAYTYPVGLDLGATWNGDRTLLIDKTNGYRFKKEYGYAAIICITTGLLLHPMISAAEATAIILHEIGHNFTSVAIGNIGIIHFCFNCILTVSTFGAYWLIFSDPSKKAQISFKQWMIENVPVASTLYYAFESAWAFIIYIISEVSRYFTNIGSLLNPLAFIGRIIQFFYAKFGPTGEVYADVFKFLVIPRNLITGYSDEQFADSFAASYGYAAELRSGLEKIRELYDNSIIDTAMFNVPGISWWLDTIKIPAIFVCRAFDEHPEDMARLSNNLKQMETDLKDKRYSPAMKKRLLNDIRTCREELNKCKEFEKLKDKNGNYKASAVRDAYDSMILNMFEGGDFKHRIFTFTKPENVNANFDKIMNLNKKLNKK